MKKKIVIAIIIIIFTLIILPYAYVEITTALYGKQFAEEYKQTSMISSVEYYKVFSYNNQRAKVYYVERDPTITYFVYFEKDGSKWKMTSWDTVWSDFGSASNVTFPFYR